MSIDVAHDELVKWTTVGLSSAIAYVILFAPNLREAGEGGGDTGQGDAVSTNHVLRDHTKGADGVASRVGGGEGGTEGAEGGESAAKGGDEVEGANVAAASAEGKEDDDSTEKPEAAEGGEKGKGGESAKDGKGADGGEASGDPNRKCDCKVVYPEPPRRRTKHMTHGSSFSFGFTPQYGTTLPDYEYDNEPMHEKNPPKSKKEREELCDQLLETYGECPEGSGGDRAGGEGGAQGKDKGGGPSEGGGASPGETDDAVGEVKGLDVGEDGEGAEAGAEGGAEGGAVGEAGRGDGGGGEEAEGGGGAQEGESESTNARSGKEGRRTGDSFGIVGVMKSLEELDPTLKYIMIGAVGVLVYRVLD